MADEGTFYGGGGPGPRPPVNPDTATMLGSGREGRREARRSRRENRRNARAAESAFRDYWMDRAQAVMQGEDFRDDPQEVAERAQAAASAAQGGAASQAMGIVQSAMGGDGQMQGAVQQGVGDLGSAIKDSFFQSYAGETAADREQSVRLQQQALSMGQAAAEAEVARKRQREALMLSMLAGAIEGAGTPSVGGAGGGGGGE